MKSPRQNEIEENRALAERIAKRKGKSTGSAEANKIQGSTKLALIAAAAFAIAGTYVYCSSQGGQETQNESAPAKTAPANSNPHQHPEITVEDFEKENQRLAKVEQEFLKFATAIEQKANQHADSTVKEEVTIPLTVIKGNQDNPVKSLTAIKQAAGHKTGYFSIKQKSRRHFSYAIEPMPHNIGAAYNDMGKYITLNTTFETNDLGDMFLLFHELIHVEDDRLRRERMKTDLPDYAKTLLFISSSAAVILDDEVRAHRITLKALNVYFDGALEKLGENATEANVTELFKKHGKNDKEVSNKSKVFASMIAGQTRAYYGKDSAPEDFRNLIGYIHQSTGMTLYKMTPTGALEPIQSNFRAIQK